MNMKKLITVLKYTEKPEISNSQIKSELLIYSIGVKMHRKKRCQILEQSLGY